MALTFARQALSRRFRKAFEEQLGARNDLLEQNKRLNLAGMEGGFGYGEQSAINAEFDQDKTDLLDQQKTEEQILDLKEQEGKDIAAKAKKRNLVSTLGTVATIGASLVPGIGPALGAGVGLLAQGANAMYGGAADFSNIDYSALSGMGGYFKKKRRFNNGVTITPTMEQA